MAIQQEAGWGKRPRLQETPQLSDSFDRKSSQPDVFLKTLIGGWAFDAKGNPLDCEKREGVLRHHHFAGGPALEGKSSGQETQGAAFCFVIWKPDDNHGSNLNHAGGIGKVVGL